MLFVTVYCPPTIIGAGVAFLQFPAPRFVDHCSAELGELVASRTRVLVPAEFQ